MSATDSYLVDDPVPPSAPAFPSTPAAISETSSLIDSAAPKVPLRVAPAASSSASGRLAATTFKDVVYWRNIKVTGSMFLVGNLFFFLVLVSKYTFLRVVATAGMLYFALGFLIVNGAKFAVGFTGQNPLPAPQLGVAYFSRSSIEAHADDILFLVNAGIDEVKKALFCVDNMGTLKLIAASWVLSIVGRIFPDILLAYIVFLVMFLAPITYEKNQDAIDAWIDDMQAKAKVQYEKSVSAASEQAVKLKDTVVEKGTPYLEKNAKLKDMAGKFGITPQKKTT